MRRTMTGLFAAALALGLFIAAPGFAHHPDPDDHPQGKHGSNWEDTYTCDDPGATVTYAGPEEMWPPNHKYRDLSVTAEKEDSDAITLDTFVTHNEYTDPVANPDPSDPQNPGGELNGAGNTADDADPFWANDTATNGDSAMTEHNVRAERSGRGVGRVYTVYAWATFNGEPCNDDMEPVTWEIEVPHSMGNSATVKKNHNE